jgi:diguanylate cyclase (GGDEF)-like protein
MSGGERFAPIDDSTPVAFDVLDFLTDPVFVVAVDPRTVRPRFRWVYANAAWRAALGLAAGAPLSSEPADHLPEERAARHLAHYSRALRVRGTVRFEELDDRIGREYAFDITPITNAGGACTHLVVAAHDETEHHAVAAELRHQARHDALTGLGNRVLLVEALTEALRDASRTRTRVGLLLLDIDHFKVVNDSLGHEVGDQLFAAAAKRIENVLRAGDTLARFGGDELAVVCRDIVDSEQVNTVATRVRQVFEQPFGIDSGDVFLSVSVGVVVSHDGGDTPERMLRDADVAMFSAKALGRDRVEVFDEQMRARAVARLDIEKSLRQALLRNEFRVHYQPLVDFERSEVTGFEALLRWQHPERGLVGPDQFLGIAEETGLIVPIGAWVLHEVCHQAAAWLADADPESPALGVAVNLSARQLAHPDLVGTVAEALAASGLPPELLVLEITESVLMSDRDLAVTILYALRSLGVHTAVDDFGTGQSSLGYLKTLPVDSLKIDRSFICGLGSDPDDAAIVSAVVHLGHALGLTVTAEGIETARQLSELRDLGCDLGQGFYFAKPQPSAIAGALVRRRLRFTA